MENILEIKLLRVPNEGINIDVIPQYKTPGSAGCDLVAAIREDIVIAPGERVLLGSGIAVLIGDPGYVAVVSARSGLSTKHGITLTNGIGIIDSDYTGEIKVGLINLSDKPYTVRPGDRIAQMLFLPVFRAEFEIVDLLPETNRGDGGFGSTGR